MTQLESTHREGSDGVYNGLSGFNFHLLATIFQDYAFLYGFVFGADKNGSKDPFPLIHLPVNIRSDLHSRHCSIASAAYAFFGTLNQDQSEFLLANGLHFWIQR